MRKAGRNSEVEVIATTHARTSAGHVKYMLPPHGTICGLIIGISQYRFTHSLIFQPHETELQRGRFIIR